MVSNASNAAILGLGTALPEHLLEQGDVAARLAESLRAHPDAGRWAKRIFRHMGVDTRYTCEPNLLEPADRCRYNPSTPLEHVPTTADRMETYRCASVPLAAKAAKHALYDAKVAAADITHLLAVSCTGMFLPGLDAALVQELGLAPDVQRIPLLFLGCAAGMTAIRTAQQLVEACPNARALIVCVELCTLHVQPSASREDLFAAAFFGDGASACVVGTPDDRHSHTLSLHKSKAVLLPDSAEHMAWHIGDYGFRLTLSSAIPELIGKLVPPELETFWGSGEKPELWAIHPGGRGIVDSIQTMYGLTDEQTEASRTVLRQYGNMSSATILFVLEELRSRLVAGNTERRLGVALAFGPGLQAELLQIVYEPVPSRSPSAPNSMLSNSQTSAPSPSHSTAGEAHVS